MAPADPARRRDPDRTRREILDVATAEFADRGFSGARVDEIAARTRTTKRMIYYYFESKEGLYLAVLEAAYAAIRVAGAAIWRSSTSTRSRPSGGSPSSRSTTTRAHPDFIRLVAIENIHRAEHLRDAAGPRLAWARRRVDCSSGILGAAAPRGSSARRRRRSTST